jgi:acetyltransferase-like isoleucine patch superfamily enzyme
VGAYAHISPGAKLLGGSIVGEQAWIGSNAVVFPTVTIAEFVTLGASSIANNNLQTQGVFVGCPAKKIK